MTPNDALTMVERLKALLGSNIWSIDDIHQIQERIRFYLALV